IEAHDLRHPGPILAIAMAFDCVKEVARAEFVLSPVNCAAGIFCPLLAGSFFFLSERYVFRFSLHARRFRNNERGSQELPSLKPFNRARISLHPRKIAIKNSLCVVFPGMSLNHSATS